jgi:two-component system sensor histidine kinase KdpD
LAIETHNRKETHELLEGLPVIPKANPFINCLKKWIYKPLSICVQKVIVDELAHKYRRKQKRKRWQDVLRFCEAGINVISAVNIQHLESLNADKKALRILMFRNAFDSVLKLADEGSC